MLLRWAVGYLVRKLKSDKQLWWAWQCNIAMTIYDEYKRYAPPTNDQSIHTFANKCADNFLKLLTKKKEV